MRPVYLGKQLNYAQVKELMLNTKPIAQATSLTNRKLIITPIPNAYSKVGSVLFSIEGTPPKGYAIYIPEIKTLTLFDWQGNTIKIFKDVRIKTPNGEVAL